MSSILVVLFLIYEAYEDWKYKSISLTSLIFFGIVGIFLNFSLNKSAFEYICQMAVGMIVILISIITGGMVGIGDGILLMVLGIYIGTDCVNVLFWAFLTASIISLMEVLFMNKGGKHGIPFVPCILLAYLEVFLFES